MSHKRGDYDSDLQMFVERPREPDQARLRFVRWLVERGLLEHDPVGLPTGCYATPPLRASTAGVDRALLAHHRRAS